MPNKIKEEDLAVLVLEVVSAAAEGEQPILYARGPLSERRLKEEFLRYGIRGVHGSTLCTVVKRLVAEGVLVPCITNGYRVVYLSDRDKTYPTYKLLPAA